MPTRLSPTTTGDPTATSSLRAGVVELYDELPRAGMRTNPSFDECHAAGHVVRQRDRAALARHRRGACNGSASGTGDICMMLVRPSPDSGDRACLRPSMATASVAALVPGTARTPGPIRSRCPVAHLRLPAGQTRTASPPGLRSWRGRLSSCREAPAAGSRAGAFAPRTGRWHAASRSSCRAGSGIELGG